MSREHPAGVVGARLRAARTAAGMSQAHLAAKSGIPKPRISQYENEHLSPSLTTLSRLARALGISEAGLLAGSDAEAVLLQELRRVGFRLTSVDDAVELARKIAGGEVGEREAGSGRGTGG